MYVQVMFLHLSCGLRVRSVARNSEALVVAAFCARRRTTVYNRTPAITYTHPVTIIWVNEPEQIDRALC
jgi:hypothetical protein